LINKKGIERRQQERIDVKGKTIVQLLENDSKPIGKPFKGDLTDVSLGGLAFTINTKKQDTARLLLGRKLKIIAGIVTVDSPIEISREGTIIGAKEKKRGQYSIHLKFDTFVSENKIEKIRSIAIPE
jgi:c-di-GMP-binding flagellar brake protein YcgR